jgi:hypothetical protein
MAEIRCPMCGRPNPDDRDVCEFCGARLKPLTGALAAANEDRLPEQPPQGEPVEGTIHPGDEPTPKSTSELENTLPEWLRNIRKSEAEAAAQPAADLSDQGEPADDDFFKRLSELDVGGEPGEAEPAEAAPEPAPVEDDLLSRLSSLGEEPASVPETQPAESADEEPGEEAAAPVAPAVEPASDEFLAGLSALSAGIQAEPPAGPVFEQPEGGSPEQSPQGEAAEAPTDWLAGLSSAMDDDEEETPDWLKSITGQIQQQAPAEPGTGAEAEAVDWRAQLEEEEKAAAATPPKPEPEWKGFLGEADLPAAELTERAPESEESLEWLKDLEAQAEGGSEPASQMGAAGEETPAAGEAPDWLSGLGTGVEAQAPALGEVPGETPAAAAEDVPDWLKSIQADETPAATPTPEEELPDWLKPAIAGTMAAALTPEGSSQEPGVGPAEETFEAGAATPDWLKDLQPEAATTQPSFAETPPAADAEEEIPDWLKAATAAGATMVTIKPEEPAPAEAETPDWLKTAAAAGATVTTIKPEEPAPAEEETPDWLKAAAAAGATMVTIKPEEPAAGESQPEQEPVPGWLSEAAAQPSAAEPGATEPAEAIPAEAEEETPDWLRATLVGGAAAAALSGKPEPAEELFPADMPDWLADIKPAQEGATAPALSAAEGPAGEAPISEGELPSWVQAMRPVEAAAGEGLGAEEEQVVEQSGPLSGFSNVLPAAVGAAGVRKVSAYPNKMLVNESQQGQIELLERLVAGEGAAKPVGAHKRMTSNRWLRWGIAALLLVFVMLPVMLGTELTPAVSLYPPELTGTIKAVNELPANPTVLVVVDYQPAFSGEMEAATTPLLDQLRLEGATVVFVSSSSTGSALADRLVARVNSDLAGAAPQQYVNLGYLTGGASGITNFVADPVQAAPHTIAGAPAWDLPPLQDIDSLGDFDALVVLTDSSDTGAIWIEQSRRLLDRSPLLMAISAQAEPMLRPYYDSGQVQGMVTGLAGGVAYEQANGIPSIGSSYWDPFSVGFLVADFIVAVGGVMALLAAWQARRAQTVPEAH